MSDKDQAPRAGGPIEQLVAELGTQREVLEAQRLQDVAADAARELLETVIIRELRKHAKPLPELNDVRIRAKILQLNGDEQPTPQILITFAWPAGEYLDKPRRAVFVLDGIPFGSMIECRGCDVDGRRLVGQAIFSTMHVPAHVAHALASNVETNELGTTRMVAIAHKAAAVYLLGSAIAEGETIVTDGEPTA